MLRQIKNGSHRGVLAAAFFMAVPLSHAHATDELIEGAKLCTKYLPRYEREYGIPTHLLTAIATTESGRYHKGLKINIPWPWTINAQGKGYYYGSKREAVAAARKFQAQGIKSIDVGCMQVNLYHHPDAFASLEQAFEPQNNVAYAASFLRNLYQDGKSWKKAAGDYHSKTPSRGRQYVGSVYNSWYKIIEKLRAAKLQAGSPDSAPVVVAAAETPKPAAKPVASRAPAPLPEQRGKQVAEYKAPRMKVIELSKKDVAHNNVVVVRPEIKVVDTPTTVTVAKVQPASLKVIEPVKAAKPVAQVASNEVAIARPTVATTKKTGPTFIFND